MKVKLFSSIAFVFFLSSVPAPAHAQNSIVATALKTIYPGQILSEDMIEFDPAEKSSKDGVFDDRNKVLGKIARRTFLAGKPISADSLGDPPVVANGALVQIVYRQDGIEIVTTGQALNSASVGASVRVRNSDSGLTIMGMATEDGKVRVSE